MALLHFTHILALLAALLTPFLFRAAINLQSAHTNSHPRKE